MNDPRDVTPIDHTAAETADLRRQVEDLRQAVRARDDFIAIAAHELRNPMMPLLGVTELALNAARRAGDTCPPRLMALLERMQLAVQNYMDRATRLLDVSRIDAGNIRLEPIMTDLSALALAVAHRYDATALGTRSAMRIEVEDGVHGTWDPLAVERVLDNLLSNALKFGLGRPVTLRLRPDEAGLRALLEVQDGGLGMNSDQQARIFGRFEQVVTQHHGGGFGVGLWVANQLVSAMGGRITVASCPGEGSTFTVTLPLTPSGPRAITA